MAAADHGEGFGAVEGGAAGVDGDGFFAGVDDVAGGLLEVRSGVRRD